MSNCVARDNCGKMRISRIELLEVFFFGISSLLSTLTFNSLRVLFFGHFSNIAKWIIYKSRFDSTEVIFYNHMKAHSVGPSNSRICNH